MDTVKLQHTLAPSGVISLRANSRCSSSGALLAKAVNRQPTPSSVSDMSFRMRVRTFGCWLRVSANSSAMSAVMGLSDRSSLTSEVPGTHPTMLSLQNPSAFPHKGPRKVL